MARPLLKRDALARALEAPPGLPKPDGSPLLVKLVELENLIRTDFSHFSRAR
jgi:hypothetical protein